MDIALLIQVAPGLLRLARAGLAKFLEDSTVATAISATDSAIRDVECAPSLRKWSGSESFLDLLREIETGKEPPTGDDVLEAYVSEGEFYFEGDEETRRKAQEILETFFRALHKGLLGGDEALVYLDARQQQALRKQTDEIRQVVGEIVGAGLITASAPAEGGSVEGLEQGLQAKIDLARDLINAGKFLSARDILINIRRETDSQSPSEDLLFRIATNLGACWLALGDATASEREYRLAHELRPDEPRIVAALSRAALNRKAPTEALELAESGLQNASRHPHLVAAKLLALNQLEREGEIEELLANNRWILADPVAAGTLGEIRLDQGRFSEAEELLRRSLGGTDVDTAAARAMLAVAIATPVQAGMKRSPPVGGLPDEADSRLAEAELELSRAIDAFQHQEVRTRLLDALASRAGVRAMRGQLQPAIEDANRVLLDDPEHRVALLNRAMVLLRMDRYAEAATDLGRLVPENPEDPALNLLYGVALAGSDRTAAAVEVLESAWDGTSEDPVQLEIADVLMRSAWDLSDRVMVERIADEIQRSPASAALRKTVLARQLLRQDEIQEAIPLLEEAVSEAEVGERSRIERELAEAFFRAERFQDAARVYAGFVDKTEDSPTLRSYLAALFNAGVYGTALEIAQGIRRGGRAIPVISEVEARVLQVIGDLPQAIHIYLELAELEPHKPAHVIDAAGMQLRLGDKEASKETLHAISYDSIRDDSSALFRVAELRMVLGEGGVLELAYRARRLSFDDVHAHARYIHLFLNSEALERELLSADVVKADTSVRLLREQESRVVSIVDDDLTSLARSEVRPADPLAQHLLDHRAGDSVVLREGLEDLEYEVVEVQSKYVAAFQETLLNFSTWFPEESHLQRVEVGENDFSRIFAAVDARSELAQQVTSMYRTKPATLGVLASLLGCSPIDVWVGLVGLHDTRFIVAEGFAGEVQEAANLLSEQEEVTIDLTALLTMAHIGLLERLSERFPQLICAQSVVDTLLEHIEVNYRGATPTGTLAKRGTSYVHVDHSPEDLERGRRHLESMLEFLQERTRLEPVHEALAIDADKLEEMGNLIGPDARDSILLARQSANLIYSDDLRLRQLAKGEHGVDAVWSQPILVDLQRRNLISDEEQREALIHLLLSNYVFISISAEDLVYGLKAEEYARSARSERLLARALGPESALETAVVAAAGVVRSVWLDNLLHVRKTVVLDLVLESLMNGRVARRRVLQELVRALQMSLSLVPLTLHEVIGDIRAWAQAHSI